MTARNILLTVVMVVSVSPIVGGFIFLWWVQRKFQRKTGTPETTKKEDCGCPK